MNTNDFDSMHIDARRRLDNATRELGGINHPAAEEAYHAWLVYRRTSLQLLATATRHARSNAQCPTST
jgi:hypothetical protein